MPHVELSPHAHVPTPSGAVGVGQPGNVTVDSSIPRNLCGDGLADCSSMPVTLTFDNGPAPGTTDHVLDVLAERGLRATFFVVGAMLEQPGARARAERAVEEGHWIGNHSMTHSTPLVDAPDDAYAADEIDGAQALLDGLGHERRFFRPFGLGGLLGPH